MKRILLNTLCVLSIIVPVILVSIGTLESCFIGSSFCEDVAMGLMLLTCVGTPLYYCVELLIYELSK